jgi:hypothetical protein
MGCDLILLLILFILLLFILILLVHARLVRPNGNGFPFEAYLKWEISDLRAPTLALPRHAQYFSSSSEALG